MRQPSTSLRKWQFYGSRVRHRSISVSWGWFLEYLRVWHQNWKFICEVIWHAMRAYWQVFVTTNVVQSRKGVWKTTSRVNSPITGRPLENNSLMFFFYHFPTAHLRMLPKWQKISSTGYGRNFCGWYSFSGPIWIRCERDQELYFLLAVRAEPIHFSQLPFLSHLFCRQDQASRCYSTYTSWNTSFILTSRTGCVALLETHSKSCHLFWRQRNAKSRYTKCIPSYVMIAYVKEEVKSGVWNIVWILSLLLMSKKG